MAVEEVKSSVLRKVRSTTSITLLRKIEKIIDNPDKKSLLVISQKLKKKIAASKQDIESGKLIENKLLRKEIRIWLRSR